MTDLFENFARHAKDIEHLHAGETMLVGMPGTMLAGQAFLCTAIDLKTGIVDLRNISRLTPETFSSMVQNFLRTSLTREEDNRFIINGGPVKPNDAYIITDSEWGDHYEPVPCGYYNMFASQAALVALAEGFGPDDFLVLRGHTESSVEELKTLLDHNIVVAIDANPDLVFSRNVYDESVEKAVHLSLLHQIHGFRP